MGRAILFRRNNPNLELEVVGVNEYRVLEKKFKEKINSHPGFCGWESGGRIQGHNLATAPEDFS